MHSAWILSPLVLWESTYNYYVVSKRIVCVYMYVICTLGINWGKCSYEVSPKLSLHPEHAIETGLVCKFRKYFL